MRKSTPPLVRQASRCGLCCVAIALTLGLGFFRPVFLLPNSKLGRGEVLHVAGRVGAGHRCFRQPCLIWAGPYVLLGRGFMSDSVLMLR